MSLTIPSSGWKIAVAVSATACFVVSSVAAAAQGNSVPLADRIRGAGVVVVATPTALNARWQQNAFGDRLIVSRFTLHVEEKLKGTPAADVLVDLEGGTLDGVTLQVSTLPELAPGERAVFFLDSVAGGAYEPHLRGQGILKLDAQNMVKGSSLSLDEIRRVAATTK
jgi:hypothetical protein